MSKTTVPGILQQEYVLQLFCLETVTLWNIFWKLFCFARTKLFESSKNCLNSVALDTGAQALILFPGNKLSQQYSVFSPIPASAEWSVTGLFALAKSVYLNSEDHPVARRFNGSYLLVIDACSVSDISSCEVW